MTANNKIYVCFQRTATIPVVANKTVAYHSILSRLVLYSSTSLNTLNGFDLVLRRLESSCILQSH